ncbi:MAG: lipopolysaccharide assembly protein LapB [Methanoregulaceae archaeon]|nr:lipopolysaccharide assembly protein LapB [Methanoregulaceae archaeon]
MEFEYWWLLGFPLFFALGWLAARVDIKHLLSESRTLPSSYFRGLNFLLNEQQDKAIEAFIEVARGDQDTVELHFALGSLFRRRGEVDRAIRMHQSLFDRTDLDEERKLQALFELGQDYLKAGLLDRAEQLFAELEHSKYAANALKFLLEIYVQEKDWQQAIQVAQRLGKVDGHSYQAEIAHFYCELAEVAHARADSGAARDFLTAALEANRNCVRASVLLGDIELAAGRHEAAIHAWEGIEGQNPELLSLVGERLLATHREIGRLDEGVALLRGYLEKHGSIDLLNVIFQTTLEDDGPEAAYRLVRDELRRNPTLQGLDKLLEARLLETTGERHQDIRLIKNLIQRHVGRLVLYRCNNCGFKAKQYYWHCPACGGWETFPARRNEEYTVP